MKIIDNIKGLFNRNDTGRKMPVSFHNPPIFLNSLMNRNTGLPTHNSIANTCINIRSWALANIHWNVNIGEEPAKEDHWMAELLDEPNPEYSRMQFFMRMQYWYDIAGNVYLYVPPNEFERKPTPRQIQILQSNNVTIKLNSEGIEYYRYRRGGSDIYIPPEYIIHIANYYPTSRIESEYMGVPVIDSIKNILEADREMSAYLKRYLANDEVGPLYIESEDEWTPARWSHFSTQWNEKLKNHRLMGVLGSGNKLLPLGSTGVKGSKNNIKDIDEIITKKIAAAMGIPLELILTNASNYATAKVAQYRFIKNTMEPLATLYSEKLTNYFKKFEDGINIDYEKIKYVDEELELKRIDSDIGNGILTVNDIRAGRGLEDIGEDGDRRFIKNSLLPYKPEPEEEEEEPEPEPEPEPQKAMKKSYDIDKYYIKKQQDLDRNEAVLNKALAGMFGEIKDLVLSNVSDKKSWDQKAINVNAVISAAEFIEYYKKYIPKVLQNLIMLLFEEALKDVDIDMPDIETTMSKELKRVISTSADKIVTIREDFIDSLKSRLGEVKEKPVDKVEETVNEFFKDYERDGYKTRRIAQTTSTAANGSAQKEVWQKFDVKYVWLTQRDGKVRPSHKKLDGTSPDSNGVFTTDDEGEVIKAGNPGDFGSAGNDINCRCVLRPRL